MPLRDADTLGQTVSTWKLGPPIVTYWNAGDKLTLTDEIARRAVAGGYNLVWVTDLSQLAIAQQYGLRTQLINQALLTTSSLDNPTKLAQLNALIDRYKTSSAAYTYFVTDEPNAKAFADCARLVAHIRQRDPGHLAYINLLPFSCTAEELGTLGDTTAAYNAYLSQYVNTVQPSLLSYDHYQFLTTGDSNGYLKNLAVVGEASRQAGVPFMNIVQACGWKSGLTFRVPTGNEMRYLVYTTLAYGAQGISYYYYDTGVTNSGGLINPDGVPTAIYTAIAAAQPRIRGDCHGASTVAISRSISRRDDAAGDYAAGQQRPVPSRSARALDAVQGAGTGERNSTWDCSVPPARTMSRANQRTCWSSISITRRAILERSSAPGSWKSSMWPTAVGWRWRAAMPRCNCLPAAGNCCDCRDRRRRSSRFLSWNMLARRTHRTHNPFGPAVFSHPLPLIIRNHKACVTGTKRNYEDKTIRWMDNGSGFDVVRDGRRGERLKQKESRFMPALTFQRSSQFVLSFAALLLMSGAVLAQPNSTTAQSRRLMQRSNGCMARFRRFRLTGSCPR